MAHPAESFPRQQARTRRFTLGQPRTFTATPDGGRVFFLRSPAGDDPVTCLWAWEDDGGERLLVDPRALGGSGDGGLPAGGPPDGELPAAERARRERVRETAGGIVGYAGDRDGSLLAFGLAGALWVHEVASGRTRLLVDGPGVVEARPDPTGQWVAFGRDGGLWVVPAAGGEPRALRRPAHEHETWGLAEFVAAEEMGRTEGYWWAPDGGELLAARVDEAGVAPWWIADPSRPEAPPREVRYPAAGGANARVELHLLGLDGAARAVGWDVDAFPYLVSVHWAAGRDALVTLQTRDQRTIAVHALDRGSGRLREVARRAEQPWAEIVPGVPRWHGDALLTVAADAGTDTMRLYRDGAAVSPAGVQVRAVVHADGAQVLFSASAATEPTEVHLWRWAPDGCTQLTTEPGVHHGVAAAGDLLVTASADLATFGPRYRVRRGSRVVATVSSRAATPVLTPQVTLYRVGARELAAAVVLPSAGAAGPLPVLMAPYGGPHTQRVLATRALFLEAQWWADAGFAVVVVDGRGTPGRGPAWAAAVAGDLATAALEDQVAGLAAVAARCDALDLSRVAIHGWSFGGYLAALAVLRRPDVFHAAVAGAPVTEWRLYDTHYTERYLGLPAHCPAAYDRTSLLGEADRLRRPLLLVHGLADDNVVVAHTLRFSQALLRAGRPHSVLPLSGVTHMTPQPEIAENLLLLQRDFLYAALGMGGDAGAATSAAVTSGPCAAAPAHPRPN